MTSNEVKNILLTEKEPNLAIVIASQNAIQSVAECLKTLETQSIAGNIEIIIVDNSTDETKALIKEKFSKLKLIDAPLDCLIPQLWGIGIDHSNSRLVALTTTHFVPNGDWTSKIITAHNSEYSGIGGAIENADQSDLVSWAIYFCRYSRYMKPFATEEVEDFAADNSSYKRADLERVKYAMQNGFWEFFVHQAMLKEGMHLTLTDEIVVYQQKSFSFNGFIHQRFRHGKQFGSNRCKNISNIKRLILIMLSPFIPFIYVYRIAVRIFTRKRHLDKFVLSFPILLLFLVSWSFGEFCGYLWKDE